ncbi:MAG: MFS transporter [Spirochaetales bacterium]|nr:MFS transporter [Spirochaetales bacterium]
MKKSLAFLNNQRIQQALGFSIFDGVLWAIMFGFAENYVVPFALFFGATAFQVSLLQGSMQFGVSMGQVLGSTFSGRFPRKTMSMIGNALHSLSFIIIAFGTVWLKNPLVILIAFPLGAFATNFAGPGWISWMNDTVPSDVRGRFWGLRNRFITFAQLFAMIIAGVLLFWGENNQDLNCMYLLIFSIGAFSRLISLYPLYRQWEPEKNTQAESTFSLGVFLKKLRHTNFGRFAIFNFLLTYSVNILLPAFSVYILHSMEFNYLQYTIIVMSSMVSTFIAMSYWGKLADKFGNYKILLVTAVALPLIAFCWVFLKDFYLMILLQLFSGFVWSGFNLSNGNFLFDSIKPQNVAKAAAYYNSMNNLFAFLGSLTGGFLALATPLFNIPFFAANNYELIFIVSGVLRVVVIIFLIKKFSEVREVQPSPGLGYFYLFKPMDNMINRIQLLAKKKKRPKED